MKKQVSINFPSKFTIGIVGVFCLVIVLAGFYYFDSLIPVNTDTPIFGVPENHFIKVVRDFNGNPTFAIQSSKGGKVIPGLNTSSPQIVISKGSIVAFHIINEVQNTKNEKSLYDFHIDEFNVHSKKLEYFQTNTITFVADKSGTFEYYSSIHPEMTGKIHIE